MNVLELANRFGSYFYSKIEKICEKLDSTDILPLTVSVPEACCSSFSHFTGVSEEDVCKVIMESASKSCRLDPIPTWLLKKLLDVLLPHITRTINASLLSGVVPDAFKLSHIVPLLKKHNLDYNQVLNNRPVANLPFLFKILERIVCIQIKEYMCQNNLYSAYQYAYRQYHSTEIAILSVTNDILLALEKGDEAVLVLLDYSAAFDTINHKMLFERFQTRYGICGTALKWCISYLENRKQAIVISDSISDPFPLPWGVPQGSVKGPLDFIMYSAPLSDVINAHKDINHVIYADDTQLFLTMRSTYHSEAVHKLERCIADVRSWAIQNKLMLNDSKTEIVHFRSKFRSNVALPLINIGGCDIKASYSAKDLGIILDNTLELKDHVRNVCRKASFGIYRIGRIRKYLDRTSTERLVHAFVSSHLDCNNSILYGVSNNILSSLQRVQNSAARLITCIKRHEHISPVLRELHWLTVSDRIRFKILLLTYKAIHGQSPMYIQHLITLSANKSLRSASQFALQPGPRVKTSFYGDHAFSVAAPKLWNSIPYTIHSAVSTSQFKQMLKTFLFTG